MCSNDKARYSLVRKTRHKPLIPRQNSHAPVCQCTARTVRNEKNLGNTDQSVSREGAERVPAHAPGVILILIHGNWSFPGQPIRTHEGSSELLAPTSATPFLSVVSKKHLKCCYRVWSVPEELSEKCEKFHFWTNVFFSRGISLCVPRIILTLRRSSLQCPKSQFASIWPSAR